MNQVTAFRTHEFFASYLSPFFTPRILEKHLSLSDIINVTETLTLCKFGPFVLFQHKSVNVTRVKRITNKFYLSNEDLFLSFH